MDRKSLWTIAGAIVLGAVIFSFSQGLAQRDFRTDTRQGNGHVARYQVVNVTEGEVIIMDVTTGDLYSAKPKDVKPYSERPRPNTIVEKPKDFFQNKEKESSKEKEFPKEKEGPRFKEKDEPRFKEKDKE